MPRSKKVLTDEERAAIRAKQNESLRPGRIGELPRAPDGKVLPKGKKVRKLSSQKHDDLVAIDHVLTQPPEADRTYQQANFRRLAKDDLAGLYRLKSQLEARKPPERAPEGTIEVNWEAVRQWPKPDWTQFPKCPCCDRPAPIKDPNTQKVKALIDERMKAEMAKWTDEELLRRNRESKQEEVPSGA